MAVDSGRQEAFLTNKNGEEAIPPPSNSKSFVVPAYALFAYQSELIAVKFAHFSGKSSSA